MTAAAVDVRGFGLRHVGRSQWALRDLDLTIGAGERVLLLGASGSGKSTMLRAVAGLLDADAETEGSVTVDGVSSTSPRARAKVGLVLQDPDAHLVLPRVVDDVAFGLRNRGAALEEATRAAHDALQRVGLAVADGRRTDTLSGGERQRVALAGALALRPQVMLLDEPTSMLDAEGATDVREAVAHLLAEQPMTLVVVEHRTDQWRHLVDRVVVLTPTGVTADGTPDDVLTDRSLMTRGVWVSRPPSTATRARATGSVQEPLLQASAVTWRYRGADADALRPVSLKVEAAGALAVTGRNGTGKSSLVALLGGLRAPSSGTVIASAFLRGRLAAAPARWRSPQLAGRIATVFQNPEHSFVRQTVADEVAVGLRLVRDRVAVAAGVGELLERLRLSDVAAANPFTLSGGQQRRLSVAAAIAAAPSVLVLDEPTFGQDPVTWSELVALLTQHQHEGGASVLATHDRWLVDALADREVTLR